MSARDAIALLLVSLGLVAVTAGGFLWCPAAGLIIPGFLAVFLGVLVSAGGGAPPRTPS